MHRKPWWIGVLLGAAVLVFNSAVPADESDPLPAPKGTTQARAISAYNEGVKLLHNKHYAVAQDQFEQALALNEELAEAHNNLAFSLRMQGAHNAERALSHYNRALELKPDLAQAYMYRGILFTQMGDLDRARADHVQLLTLDRKLAAKLERIMAGGSERDDDGMAAAYD